MLTCAEPNVVRVLLVLQTFASETVYTTGKLIGMKLWLTETVILVVTYVVVARKDELTPAGLGWVRCP